MSKEYSPFIADIQYRGRNYHFEFKIAEEGALWWQSFRAYIVKAPSYGSRSDSFQITHRLGTRDNPYVCWNSRISELKQMKAVCRLWAKATVMYIADGGTLDEHAAKVQKSGNF